MVAKVSRLLFCAGFLFLGAMPCVAGKNITVCRDANGNPYFSDSGCPREMAVEGRVYAADAQTYEAASRAASSWTPSRSQAAGAASGGSQIRIIHSDSSVTNRRRSSCPYR